jgi:NADH pyrophosphatase NudC (nudix superfamily)
MIYLQIILIIVLVLMLLPENKCSKCGGRNYSYHLQGVEESKYCTNCNHSYYDVEM